MSFGTTVRPDAGALALDVPRAGTTIEPSAAPANGGRPPLGSRVCVDGKLFACGGERFPFRGVTYGTFRRRGDGALFPERAAMARDLEAIADAGFTVVRTYTPPPEDLLELAGDQGLRVFAGAFYSDWRYLLGDSRRERDRVAREAREAVRSVSRTLSGNPIIAALSIGNEVPGDVVRWVGLGPVSRLLGELVEIVRDEDPELLVSYGNYPTTEYLSLPALDFVTFNVFLEDQEDFRAYVTRLHNLAGDRPVVLGEIGLDAGRGEELQADTLDWQLATAAERGIAGTCVFSWTDEWWVDDRPVEGWRFGLTTADRSARPSLAVAERWNRSSLADLRSDWPSVSVVICARNSAHTLEECLTHASALDYPEFEIVVVDDGSSDETAAIGRCHPEVELVSIPASGLAAARNAGARAARCEIVAFLDSDAFPPPEWLYLLALGFDAPRVGGVGGPNLPPRDDPLVAQAVARSPGGPVHVLFSDDRAEHIPGCNMAFWREVFEEVGGFDPCFTAAGDDVDFCWRVLASGWEIGFHPAAFVWHRRRTSVSEYVRQQRGYGRAEALVQGRHPERFTAAGTARWRGSIYASLTPRVLRPRVYHGLFGSAAYQSVYQTSGDGMDIAHQVGVPVAALALLTAPATLMSWALAAPAILGLAFLALLAGIDGLTVRPPPGHRRAARLRLLVAWLHLVQPLARLRGRAGTRVATRRNGMARTVLSGSPQRLPGGVLLLPLVASRVETSSALVASLRAAGMRVDLGGGFESFDSRVFASLLVAGELLTSGHPEGCAQLRIRPRPRVRCCALLAVAIVALALSVPVAAGVVLAAGGVDAAFGLWRLGPAARRAITNAATADG